MRAILIDGPNKGEIIDLACKCFPDVVKTYPPLKPETTFTDGDKQCSKTIGSIVYYFKGFINPNTAEYSIEVIK